LFCLGDKVFHLSHAHLQTLMYLTLSVAGHLTIFLARTRGPFYSIRPARVLILAVLGTQALATLIAVYGVFMTPLGWGYAALVWGYALVWFLLTDRIKLLAYRFLDPVKANPVPVGAGVPADVPSAGPGPAIDLRRAAAPKATVASKATVAPFHAGSGSDGVYHDNRGCAYGQELKANGHSKRGKAGRRKCDWCAQHAA
jgi:H+-transporting ATPase